MLEKIPVGKNNFDKGTQNASGAPNIYSTLFERKK